MRFYSSPDVEHVSCGICSAPQVVPPSAAVFVCYSCRSANLVPRAQNTVRIDVTAAEPTGKEVTLHRVTDTFYKVDNDVVHNPENSLPPLAASSSDPPPVRIGQSSDQYPIEGNQCTVCMDHVADTVLMPCAHGGICSDCADALVRRSLLSGGALCPQCRCQIDSLIKLNEMDDQIAKGVEVRIPRAVLMINNQPISPVIPQQQPVVVQTQIHPT
jgi:hypothetical protein